MIVEIKKSDVINVAFYIIVGTIVDNTLGHTAWYGFFIGGFTILVWNAVDKYYDR